MKKKYNLTKAEVNTIKEINLGLGIKEIAEKNYISAETVKTHKKNAFEKLGINKVSLLANFFK
jgi:DNA-binding CsgD family transcriptional regulator